MGVLFKKLSAWLPIAMSLIVLLMLLGFFIRYGVVHETDEGAAAHIFQILMAAQIPFIGFCFLSLISEHPKTAVKILVLQVLAALMACAPVWYFKL